MYVKQLICWSCGCRYDHRLLINLCECGKPLRVDYDLPAAGRTLTKESLAGRLHDIWRYREVLPVAAESEIPTLGEGGSPLIPGDSLAQILGMNPGSVLVKD